MQPQEEWLAVARLLKPRGNRGELSAIAFSSRPERYENLREVFLFATEGPLREGRAFRVEEIWEHQARLIFKFEGIDSISAAEELRGMEVRVPFTERPELPSDEYYHSDLIGCLVTERSNGEAVGKVAGVEEFGGPLLLRVEDTAGRELLVPFARSICVEIDVAGKRIVVELPEGLKELNRP